MWLGSACIERKHAKATSSFQNVIVHEMRAGSKTSQGGMDEEMICQASVKRRLCYLKQAPADTILLTRNALSQVVARGCHERCVNECFKSNRLSQGGRVRDAAVWGANDFGSPSLC